MKTENEVRRTISARKLGLGLALLAGSLGIAWAGYVGSPGTVGETGEYQERAGWYHEEGEERYEWKEEERGRRSEGEWRSERPAAGISASQTMRTLYTEECGSCHVPYPPGMLPSQSWQKIMGTLNNHFGDNAELDQGTAARLTAWLTGSNRTAMQGASGSGQKGVPLRITETAYFRRKHRELPANLVGQGKPVSSWSACQQCHTRAEEGRYNEHEVVVPGLGRWDD